MAVLAGSFTYIRPFVGNLLLVNYFRLLSFLLSFTNVNERNHFRIHRFVNVRLVCSPFSVDHSVPNYTMVINFVRLATRWLHAFYGFLYFQCADRVFPCVVTFPLPHPLVFQRNFPVFASVSFVRFTNDRNGVGNHVLLFRKGPFRWVGKVRRYVFSARWIQHHFCTGLEGHRLYRFVPPKFLGNVLVRRVPRLPTFWDELF